MAKPYAAGIGGGGERVIMAVIALMVVSLFSLLVFFYAVYSVRNDFMIGHQHDQEPSMSRPQANTLVLEGYNSGRRQPVDGPTGLSVRQVPSQPGDDQVRLQRDRLP